MYALPGCVELLSPMNSPCKKIFHRAFEGNARIFTCRRGGEILKLETLESVSDSPLALSEMSVSGGAFPFKIYVVCGFFCLSRSFDLAVF